MGADVLRKRRAVKLNGLSTESEFFQIGLRAIGNDGAAQGFPMNRATNIDPRL